MLPGPSNREAGGTIAAPTSEDIVVAAASPAYCNSPGRTCAYLLSFQPLCAGRPPGCAADFTITPLGATVTVPYGALASKVEVLQDSLVPDRR